MFNFKNLGALSQISQLMMNPSSITDRAKEMKGRLAEETACGTAADGLIRVVVSGVGEVRELTICSSLIQCGSTKEIEEHLPQAINEALAQVRQLYVVKLREMAGGIELPPGLDDVLGGT